MLDARLGRRGAIAGAVAAVVTTTPTHVSRQLGGITGAPPQDPTLAKGSRSHAPFRAAFMRWASDSINRFALPVFVTAISPSQTDLTIPGMHSALRITLQDDTDINIFVTWAAVFWDILASMDVCAELAPDGHGWHNTLLIPEARRLHHSQAECWREDGFEWLLKWINDELALATHLALYGGDGCDNGGGWTAAHLAREGLLVRSGRPVSSNGPLRELLPLDLMRA
jgi:hypothetical protein